MFLHLQKELLKKANNKEAYDEIADQIFKLREQREKCTVDTAAIDARNPLDPSWSRGFLLLFATSVIWRFIFPYNTVFRMIALFMTHYIVLAW